MNLEQKKIKSTKPSKFNKPKKPLDLARREDMIRQAAERYITKQGVFWDGKNQRWKIKNPNDGNRLGFGVQSKEKLTMNNIADTKGVGQ